MRPVLHSSILVLALAACSDADVPARLAAASAKGAGGATAATAATGTGGGDACSRGPLVETKEGAICGAIDGDANVFRGIPYAAPPLGPLRWKAPEAFPPWDGALDARNFGPICTQVEYPSGNVLGDEDCLTLNVWAPAAPPASPRPVLFWIHGGDNVVGSSHEYDLYDGRYLVEHRDVVVVTINYRLGAFGWLAHPAFAAEDAHGAAGNYGVLDQIAALGWVQRNIAAFGGDPSRVLVFGQSAGASNTCALLASPLASGLFSRALMQSLACYVVSPALVSSTNAAAAKALGCAGAPDVAACLRAADAADVAHVPGASLEATDVPADYYEVVDGWILPEAPEAAIAAGKHNHMPVALGTTADEYAQIISLLVTGPVDTEADYQAVVEGWFGKAIAQQVLAVYPAASYDTPRDALVAIVSDDLMHCPTRRAARAARTGQSEPVWRYLWTHLPESGPWVPYGAAHGSEIPFVFHTVDDFGPPADELALSDSVIGYWTRFAASGDPSGEGAFAWPAYDATTDSYLALDSEPYAGADVHGAQCDFWDESGL